MTISFTLEINYFTARGTTLLKLKCSNVLTAASTNV